MQVHAEYEKRIWNEIKEMPPEALPEIMRLILLVKEEFRMKDNSEDNSYSADDENICHQKTRQLLSVSRGNWAKQIISDRDDRL